MAQFRLPSFLTGKFAVVLLCWLLTLYRESGAKNCPGMSDDECVEQGCYWCPCLSECTPNFQPCRGRSGNKIVLSGAQTTCADYDHEIYVPSGANQQLDIQKNITMNNNYKYRLFMFNSKNDTINCNVSTPNITCHTNARLVTLKRKIVYNVELQYQKQNQEVWMPTEYKATVTVYNCSKLGELGCNYCKALNSSRYMCAWNTTTNTCMYNDILNDSPRQSLQCPAPIIKHIHPEDGPYSGLVTVSLTGSEFGVVGIQLSTVTVSGKSCTAKLHDLTYNPDDPSDFMLEVRTGFTCKASGEPIGNKTVFTLKDAPSTIDGNFVPLLLKNSTITRVYPDYGPRAGGTRITLYGENLGIGNRNLETVQVQGQKLIGFNISSVNNGSGDVYVIIGTIPTRENNESYTGNASFYGLLNEVNLINETVTFTFLDDPVVEDLKPTHGFVSGGTVLTVTGTNLTHCNRPVIFIRNETQNETPCVLINTTTAHCNVPKDPGWINQTLNSTRTKRATACDGCQEVEIVVKLDGIERSFTLKYYHDPSLSKFNNGLQLFSVEQQYLTIEGNNLQLLAATDVNITIGIAECKIVEIQNNSMTCAAPRQQPPPGVPGAEFPEVNVTIGNYHESLGQLQYLQYEKDVKKIVLIAGASAGGGTFLFVIAMLLICRKIRKVGSKAKKLEKDLNNLELEIKTVARQEFLDMHTSMSLVNRQLIENGFPFKPYQNFACTVLFGMEDLSPETNIHDDVRRTAPILQSFEVLLRNKLFLASLIGTMEKQKSFFIREKANFAGNLCLILMGRMDYLHEVIEDLLNSHVQKTSGQRAMKTLFRRCESITEKLLSDWLLLCLHPHLTGNTGSQLYMLYMATRKTIESGPIDALTNDTKFTLTEEKLLTKYQGSEPDAGSQDVRFQAKTLTLNVVVGNNDEIFPCKALDCDTITQVKVKCLDQIYVNYPASQMVVEPKDLILEWHSGFGGRMVLSDSDNTSIKEGPWVKLNTLAHYNVPDQSNMILVDPSDHMLTQQEDYVNLAQLVDTSSAMDIPLYAGDKGTELETDVETNPVELKPWHLVKKEEEGKHKGKTIIAELYLNRLLTTKQSLMQYVGNLFGEVLDRNCCPPPAMFLFRLLDNIGDRMNVDPNTVHAWKSHSYAIRVLASLIQSPDMLFDVTKPSYVSDNLDVISHVFIDSFELAEHKCTANSASHKLVFFNEVRGYRERVKEFYANIRGTEFDNLALMKYLNEVNEIQGKTTFNKDEALYRLFMQIKPYSEEILDDLSSNKVTSSLQLHTKMSEILTKVEED